ncbi:MAG TPA: hypothetical protein VKZ54_07940 [Membranihabitans sp.]|nr:hypothetical protein [Membranihabitans sp.]
MKTVLIIVGVLIINSCVQNYCRDDFLNFLYLEGVTIEIIKCSEGDFVNPSTILVVRITGNNESVEHFLRSNGFSFKEKPLWIDGKLESWESKEFTKQYEPYSKVISKHDSLYHYSNDTIRLSMIYADNLLFVNHGASWFQN